MDFLTNLWDLFVDMSFYLVIGLLFTGILHAFVNKDLILKHIGKRNTSSVVKASVFGVPLPLCSCGVVPTAMYLGKNGASKGAVVSFLTSTPQTGVDSIIATYGLMGPFFAFFRAIAAFFSGIISGIITNILCKNDKSDFINAVTSCGCSEPKVEETSSCCCSAPKVEETSSCCCSAPKVEETSSCCCSAPKVEETSSCGCSSTTSNETKTFGAKIKSVFTYSFGEFLDEIAVNFLAGLFVAALISTFIPQEWLSSFSNPLLSMLVMLIIGIPMYICSTASIPIAVSLMMKGISPGSAFVFLFAGPVTNIASLAILAKALGKKVLIIYLLCVAGCAILFGLILDYIIELINYDGITEVIHHSHGTPVYMVVVSVIFGLLVLLSVIRKIRKAVK